jgi:hypothetical protein
MGVPLTELNLEDMRGGGLVWSAKSEQALAKAPTMWVINVPRANGKQNGEPHNLQQNS